MRNSVPVSEKKSEGKIRERKDTKNTEVTAKICDSFWHTTLIGIPPKNNAVQNNERS
jgi:hypothetical protein